MFGQNRHLKNRCDLRVNFRDDEEFLGLKLSLNKSEANNLCQQLLAGKNFWDVTNLRNERVARLDMGEVLYVDTEYKGNFELNILGKRGFIARNKILTRESLVGREQKDFGYPIPERDLELNPDAQYFYEDCSSYVKFNESDFIVLKDSQFD